MTRWQRCIVVLASALTLALGPSARDFVLEPPGGGTLYGPAGSAALAPRAGAVLADQQFRDAWELVQDNFLDPDRLSRWDQWKERFAGRLSSSTEAEAAIRAMLDSLVDDYTYLNDREATAERQKEEREANVVESKALPGNVGYVRISTFVSRHVADETRHALERLRGSRAYVVDVRGNHGGNIHEAARVFSMFCRKGLFSVLRGRSDGEAFVERIDVRERTIVHLVNGGVVDDSPREPPLAAGKPLVVLVDGDTRSAAEMLAGALRENRLATLVGRKTFGKGVIQRAWSLGDGLSIKVCIGRYYLPGDKYIHSRGLIPDLKVGRSAAGDRALAKALSLLGQAGGKT